MRIGLAAVIVVYVLLSACRPVVTPVHTNTPGAGCRADFIGIYLARVRQDTSLAARQAWIDSLTKWGQACSEDSLRNAVALACRELGNELWESDLVAARQCYLKGLSLHPRGVVCGKLYCNVGLSYYDDQDYAAAIPYLDSALFVQPVFQDSGYYFTAALYLGDCYQRLEQPHLALLYYQKALELAQKRRDQAYISEASELMIGSYRKIKQYDKAIRSGWNGLQTEVVSPNLLIGIANAWQDSMLHCAPGGAARRQSADSALWYYNKALAQYSPQKLSGAKLTLLSNLGELYRRQGHPAAAVALHTQTIAALNTNTANSERHSRLMGRLYLNRGEALMDAGRFEAAASDLDSALCYFAPASVPLNINMPDPQISGPVAAPSLVAMTLHNQALLCVRRGTPASGNARKEALRWYDLLARFVHDARRDYLTESDKVTLTLETRPYLDSAMAVCAELVRLKPEQKHIFEAKALAYLEQSKAAALRETLLDKHAQRMLSPSRAAEKAQLIAERERITQETFLARNNPQSMATLKQEWLQHMAKWRVFQQSLASDASLAASSEGENLSVEALQREALEPGQAMLSYHRIGATLHIFVLQQDRLEWIQRPVSASFWEDMDVFDRILSGHIRFEGYNTRAAALQAIGERLYALLIPEDVLSLPPRLVIVPNDDLQALPFEALRRPGGYGDYRDFLLFHYAVSYAPSARLLWQMRHRTAPIESGARVAVFAPALPERLLLGASNLPLPVEGAIEGMLRRLPNEAEMQAVSKVIQAQTYAGAEATKQAFWEACQKYKVMHIPTHGVLYNPDPRFNFICFSQNQDTLEPRELLFMHELYEREAPLDLELVALSACLTARGPQVKSEGAMSLARGLAGMGVRSFIATLWEINMEHTTAIMPEFYRRMAGKQAMSKDVALAEAKRDFVRRSSGNRDPSQWAGLVLAGSSERLPLQPAGAGKSWMMWAICLVIGMAGGSFALRRLLRGRRPQ